MLGAEVIEMMCIRNIAFSSKITSDDMVKESLINAFCKLSKILYYVKNHLETYLSD